MTTHPRRISLDLLCAIEKDRTHANEVLSKCFAGRSALTYQEKAFITELVYGVLRWRDTLDELIRCFSSAPDRRLSRQVRNLLRLGVYQVLFLTQVPVGTNVSATVELAKDVANQNVASWVNGLLRAVDRSRSDLPLPAPEEGSAAAIALRYSHPEWLVATWLESLGKEDTLALCETNNTPPPFTIRTNTLKVSREELLHGLREEGVRGEPAPYAPEAVHLQHPSLVNRLENFQKGWFFVQDEAAQLVSHLVSPRPGERVLDLCAAPGGKATHLAQLMEDRGQVVAVDVRPEKVALVRENQVRLGIDAIDCMLMDARRLPAFREDLRFDKVLLDAPCSGLGILRRHPEGKYTKSPELLATLAATQAEMLKAAAACVKEAGVLVYSTCTLNPGENDQVVEEFLSSTGEAFRREDAALFLPTSCASLVDRHGHLRTLPHRHDMDGFFAARLRRIL